MSDARWDEITDVVVVGTGAGGMTSALLARDGGAEVLVIEKDEFIGGTTAASGGDMWIPCNRHIEGLDSREDAIAYVTRLSDGRAADPSLIEEYVDTAPEALRYLEEHTEFESLPHIGLEDYYSVVPGRIPGTKEFPRSVSAKAYPVVERLGVDGAKRILLGPWVRPVEIAYGEQLETGKVTDVALYYGGQQRIPVTAAEYEKRKSEGWRARGGALIAPLYKALIDRGVEVRSSFPATSLITDDGGVIGVVAGPAGQERRIGARRGVVLAAGGFEWNAEMVRAFLGYEVKPCTPWSNTGDGHQMAMAVGAKLGQMNGFFSYGVMYDPWKLGRDGEPLPQMEMGLGPGSIIVNQHAKRFMHGGYTYNDFSHPFNFFDQRNPGYTNKGPAWCVFGGEHLTRPYGVMGSQLVTDTRGAVSVVGPKGQPAPAWLVVANTVAELAERMRVDPVALEATINEYNEDAADGEDPQWKDPGQIRVLTGPETVTIKAIDGPFGAIQQWPGTIGTNGGLRIDRNAQVLGNFAPVIDGLYAAGNTSASVLGATYPGGGACVGPSMVTGFWAGKHLGTKAARDIG